MNESIVRIRFIAWVLQDHFTAVRCSYALDHLAESECRFMTLLSQQLVAGIEVRVQTRGLYTRENPDLRGFPHPCCSQQGSEESHQCRASIDILHPADLDSALGSPPMFV